MLQGLRNFFSLGVKAAKLTKKEVDKHLKPLVSKKLISRSEAKKLAKAILKEAKEESSRVAKFVKQEVQREVSKARKAMKQRAVKKKPKKRKPAKTKSKRVKK